MRAFLSGWVLLFGHAFASMEKQENIVCDCEQLINVWNVDCTTIEQTFDLDCSGCDCAYSGTNTTAEGSESTSPFETYFYVSLASISLLVILLGVSEQLSLNKHVKSNGLLDCLIRFTKTDIRRMPPPNKEVEMSNPTGDTTGDV